MKKKPFLLISSGVFVVAAFLIGLFLYQFNGRVHFLPEEISCRSKGYTWRQCSVQMSWGNMFCGCYVKFDQDRDKKCSGTKDCSSLTCVISYEDKPDSNGKYKGQCLEEIPEHEYETKTSRVTCGQALIEAGLITDDKRDCVY